MHCARIQKQKVLNILIVTMIDSSDCNKLTRMWLKNRNSSTNSLKKQGIPPTTEVEFNPKRPAEITSKNNLLIEEINPEHDN